MRSKVVLAVRTKLDQRIECCVSQIGLRIFGVDDLDPVVDRELAMQLRIIAGEVHQHDPRIHFSCLAGHEREARVHQPQQQWIKDDRDQNRVDDNAALTQGRLEFAKIKNSNVTPVHAFDSGRATAGGLYDLTMNTPVSTQAIPIA